MRFAIISITTLIFSLITGVVLGQENNAIPDTLKPLHQSGWALQIKGPIGDHSNETGKIVYRLTINGVGELISIDLVESTVSEDTERLYREATSKATFKRVGNTAEAAEQTSGLITYMLKNRDEDTSPDNKNQKRQKRRTKAVQNK